MGSYSGVIDGKTTREQREYAGREIGTTRSIFPWKKNHHGLVTLALTYQAARNYATDDQLETKRLAELGITGPRIFNYVAERYPAILGTYRLRMGQELTPRILMFRLANMLRDNERKTLGRGPEHPKQHPLLKRYLDAIEKRQAFCGHTVDALYDFQEEDVD